MPVLSTKEAPEFLRPYLHHRVELRWEGDADAVGTCPFCDRERKFFVSQKTGQYDCKTCAAGLDGKSGGNAYTFIRRLHESSTANTQDLEEVAHERRINVETLQRWELVRSLIDNEWILPAYGMKGEINNLYRWSMTGDKRRLLTTAKMPHCLFGFQFWDEDKPEVHILEGPWDGMAWEDALGTFKIDEHEHFTPEPDITKCVLSKVNILCQPGTGVFPESWAEQCKNKHVTIFGDNDYPREQKGTAKLQAPAALTGTRNAARKLKPFAESISILAWDGAKGFTEKFPDGHDIRDLLYDE